MRQVAQDKPASVLELRGGGTAPPSGRQDRYTISEVVRHHRPERAHTALVRADRADAARRPLPHRTAPLQQPGPRLAGLRRQAAADRHAGRGHGPLRRAGAARASTPSRPRRSCWRRPGATCCGGSPNCRTPSPSSTTRSTSTRTPAGRRRGHERHERHHQADRDGRLGTDGPLVGVQGLGCMGMSEFYGPTDEAAARATLERGAGRSGSRSSTPPTCTAGAPTRSSSRPSSRAHRDEITLATKFGIERKADDPHVPGHRATTRRTSGRPSRAACAASASTSSTCTTCTAATPPCRWPSRSARWRSWCGAGKVKHLGLSRGHRGRAARGARRAPDRRRAVGVVAVQPGRGGLTWSAPPPSWAWPSCRTPRSAAAS